MKRNCETEMDDAFSIEPVDGKTKFNDLCDHVIDMIMCNLELKDLVNISDTSTRLRGIAVGVYSRKLANHSMSIKAFLFCDKFRKNYKNRLMAEHKVIVPISGINVWFKLLRNFGASMKYLRIIHMGDDDTKILSALQNLSKYVSEYCNDSLKLLDVEACQYFTLNKPLIKLQEFYSTARCVENSEALEMMPNLRSLCLATVPKSMAKYHAKLERVSLELNSDEEVQTLIPFLQLNRQIKYLSLIIKVECRPQDTVSIYSSIADNLTQLKTFKLRDCNEPKVEYQFRYESVESFSIGGVLTRLTRFPFQFNDLKELTLEGSSAYPLFNMDFMLRNKKLKILKIRHLPVTYLDDILNLLKELPELEQIAVHSNVEHRYLILKFFLGTKWEEFEKTGKRKSRYSTLYRRFRKIKSTT